MSEEPTGLHLRSMVKREGILELSLARVQTPAPKSDEVVTASLLGSGSPRSRGRRCSRTRF